MCLCNFVLKILDLFVDGFALGGTIEHMKTQKQILTQLFKAEKVIREGRNRATLSTRCRNAIIDFTHAADEIRSKHPELWQRVCEVEGWHPETNGGDIAS